MISTSIIFIITILSFIICIFIKPSINVKTRKKNYTIQTFWIISLLGALFMLLFKEISLQNVIKTITDTNNINPLEILIIFFSMTFISTVLDEVGFFVKCANFAIKKAKNQISLFVLLYLIISILTVFTSNDIIILTFTPFICYFCKRTNINPIPFLISEFVAANSWSMMLEIGNPTNIYLSSYYHIDFGNYTKTMFLPTLTMGIVSFFITFLIFHKQLKKPFEIVNYSDVLKENKTIQHITLIHLTICTILLTISSYINISMWIICLIIAICLSIFVLIIDIKQKNKILISSYKRLPYSLVPFLISMFIMILALKEQNIIKLQFEVLNNITNNFISIVKNESNSIINFRNCLTITYGIASTLIANIVNNIPMTVAFSSILENFNNVDLSVIYATIIGSNLGACLTPIGALAGIMWLNIIRKHQIEFHFIDFIKYGLIIVFPTLFIGLVVLLFCL